MFDDLQRRADGVGEPDAGGARGSGDLQDEPADRVGGQLAVGEQIVVGLVAPDQLVLAVGRDQSEERLGRQRAAPHGRHQGAQQRMAWAPGPPVEDPPQVGLEGVEHGQPVVGLVRVDAEMTGVGAAGREVAVADVVDEARETVDGHQVVTPGARQEERRHGEVLVRGLVQCGARGGVGARLRTARHSRASRHGDGGILAELGDLSVIAVTSPVLHCSSQYIPFRTRRPSLGASAAAQADNRR